MNLLELKNWKVQFRTTEEKTIIQNLELTLEQGEILGLVGESGSGKSVSMLSMMGLLPEETTRISGEMMFDGKKYDGNQVPDGMAMVFQDSLNCLNPVMTIGEQIVETVMQRRKCKRKEAKERAVDLLETVGIRKAELCMKQYPFELSGGMRQRAVIAVALACEPKLLIADEPTTALDVTVQAGILELMRRIAKDTGTSIILISHDLGVVASLCERILIMQDGEIVEAGTAEDIFYHPQQEYTRKLLDTGGRCVHAKEQKEREVLLEVSHVSKYYESKAVDDVSFSIKKGETFGIVGESGCGKTTLARMLVGVRKPDTGEILYGRVPIHNLKDKEWLPYRKKIQMVFQDPYASLNPRMTVREMLNEPLLIGGYKDEKQRRKMAEEMLLAVGLSESHLDKYPEEFSGGQRQRIGIARALIMNPEFLICDEPTSALDASIRIQIMELLHQIQKERDLSYLLIAHDLEMVKRYSERVGVMYLGSIVEMGNTKEIYEDPWHPYTKELLAASLVSDPRKARKKKWVRPQREETKEKEVKSRCPFCDRCRFALEECYRRKPETYQYGERRIACFLYSEESAKRRDSKYKMASQI